MKALVPAEKNRPIKISHFMQRQPASVLRSKDFNQNIKDMKTKNTFATYESPHTTLMTLQSEGILCDSLNWSNGTHDGFTNGGDLDFSDWSN